MSESYQSVAPRTRKCRPGSRSKPLEPRFWAKVEKSEGCWRWLGRDGDTYGSIKASGQQYLAHRVSWELHYGPIPDGLWVLHRCDNRRCVRPDHLFLGTHADNMADMKAKGRSCRGDKHGKRKNPDCVLRGEQHGSAKLTADIVREIRALYAAGGISQPQLKRRFGISLGQVSNIVLRKQWRGVEP